MQGNVVSAARWLGASILLASVILVGGLRGVRSMETRTPPPVQATATPVEVGQSPKPDPAVVQLSGETSPEKSSALKDKVLGCDGYVEKGRTPVLDPSRRTPFLDPIPGEANSTTCLDPPSEAEVWEKFSEADPQLSASVQARRNNVRITIEKIGEKAEPCKVFPLAGLCQLVHCHYQCTVNFDESCRADSPIPFNHLKHRVEVVSIDKDHLRRCGGPVDSRTAP
jgi:hypothetical protein